MPIFFPISLFGQGGGGGGGGSPTDPNIANVVLLSGFEGADTSTSFTDESPSAHTLTANGNAQVDTAQFKFGTSSLLLDGSGDYVSTPDHADWDFGSGDFTIEFWMRWNSVGAAWLIGQWGGSRGSSSFLFYLENTNKLVLDCPGTSQLFSSVLTNNANQWYHCVGERAGSVQRIYRDGTMVGKATGVVGSQINATAALNIGAGTGIAGDLNGWMDEVRITKGVARYNSDSGYAVPTAAFPRS